jgi:hypothetical protein
VNVLKQSGVYWWNVNPQLIGYVRMSRQLPPLLFAFVPDSYMLGSNDPKRVDGVHSWLGE